MAQIGQLYVTIGADARQFTKELKKVGRDLITFSNEARNIGKTISLNLTTPLVGFAASAIAMSERARDAFKEFGDRTSESMGRLGQDLFESLNIQGILDTVASAVDKAVTAFTSLDPAVKGVVLTVGALVAAAGPAILLAGQLALVIGRVQQAVALLGLTLNFLRANPMVALVTALGTAAIAIGTYTLATSKAGDATKKLGDEVATAAEKLKSWKLENVVSTVDLAAAAKEMAELEKQIVAVSGEMQKLRAVDPDAGDIDTLADTYRELTTRHAELAEQIRNTRTETARGGLKPIMDQEAAALAKVAREYEAGGTEADRLQGRLQALVATKDRLLELDSLEDGVLSNQILKIREAEEAWQRHRQATENSRQSLESLKTPTEEFLALVREAANEVGRLLLGMVQSFSQAVGDAVARTIVYGESLAEGLSDLLKQVAAQAISTLIQISIRTVITAAVSAAAWAVAGLFATTMNPFISLALGAVVAAGAAALVYAVASAAGAAKGGIFETPGMTAIAEEGRPEIVLNQENVRRFFGEAGFALTPRSAEITDTSAIASIGSRELGEAPSFRRAEEIFGRSSGEIHIHLEQDGRETAHVVVPHLPDVLRYHGITI